jgi:heme exporter protein C
MEGMKNFFKYHLYKLIAVILIVYSIIAGLSMEVPPLPVVRESIRNVFFHVPMWFAMIAMMGVSVTNGLFYLKSYNLKYDIVSLEAGKMGIFLGLLGITSGMAWAHYAWGRVWVNDPKLNGAALSLLIYTAWLMLRSSIGEQHMKARFAAVYSIFAFVLMIVFIGVMPRMAEFSLHPGRDGNPALEVGSMSAAMRMVFLPAVAGWIMFSWWITSVRIRMRKLNVIISENENQ